MWYCGELRTVVKWWCLVVVGVGVVQVVALSGDNVCMVKQKYNITKRVKYRAPMSVRTYEWCFAMPPRCSRWTTEMRDLTRLETEERTAEVAVCCPGFKMQDISCVPICPNGKTGDGCTKDCPSNKWGPNCVHDCKRCDHGFCSAITGECQCQTGWQGESCATIIPTTTVAAVEELLISNNTTPKLILKPTANTTAFASATSKLSKISTSATIDTTITERTTVTTKMVTEAKTSIPTVEKTITYKMKTSATIAQEEKTIANVLTSTTQKTTPSTTTAITTKQATSLLSNVSLQTRSQEMQTKTYDENQHVYNRTEISTNRKTFSTDIMVTTESTPVIIHVTTSKNMKPNEFKTKQKIHSVGTTVGLDTTVPQTMSTKFKIKEIWIKPAQKGDKLTESKVKEEPQSRQRYNKKEFTPTHTTPRTIVVSIIPTSASYTLFKKIALSTTSVKHYSKSIPQNGTTHTKSIPIISSTSTTFPLIKNFTIIKTKINNETSESKFYTTETPISTLATTKTVSTSMQSTYPNSTIQFSTNKSLTNPPPTKELQWRTTQQSSVETNSMHMSLTEEYNKSSQLTTAPFKSQYSSTLTPRPSVPTSPAGPEIYKNFSTTIKSKQPLEKDTMTTDNRSNIETNMPYFKNEKTNDTKRNEFGTNNNTKTITTAVPFSNEETFHILTEPEHITAVMGDREIGRTSVDLTSVISIAGGVMMLIITLAILLVMMERRRKPRYEDIRKMEDMRMQVYLDENNVPPPPYVRSIFHTPLPDPPVAEKCHYQPISTLDRNIKQFMRPVVVQTISPVMLENFRGILECHYDHLPLRNSLPVSQDEQLTPSIQDCHELICMRPHSITETDIEALKREAKQDVIDHTTSEPLYAEIPCWRPPSEHAFEVINLNGEAVTEL